MAVMAHDDDLAGRSRVGPIRPVVDGCDHAEPPIATFHFDRGFVRRFARWFGGLALAGGGYGAGVFVDEEAPIPVTAEKSAPQPAPAKSCVEQADFNRLLDYVDAATPVLRSVGVDVPSYRPPPLPKDLRHVQSQEE